MLLAFATFVGLGGDDIPKTIFSICLGLVFAAVGLMRFPVRRGWCSLTSPASCMASISWCWPSASTASARCCGPSNHPRRDDHDHAAKMSLKGIIKRRKEGMRHGWKGTAIGSFLGFFVGILPAAGATPGSLMSYGVPRWAQATRKSIGKGSSGGVAAPEAANNSASTGAMLPMLTLGIPVRRPPPFCSAAW